MGSDTIFHQSVNISGSQEKYLKQTDIISLDLLSVSGSPCIGDRPLKTSSERKRCRAERKAGSESVVVKGQVNTAWQEKREVTERKRQRMGGGGFTL